MPQRKEFYSEFMPGKKQNYTFSNKAMLFFCVCWKPVLFRPCNSLCDEHPLWATELGLLSQWFWGSEIRVGFFCCLFVFCVIRASHCCGRSCCGAQALDAQAQQPWLMGPAAPRHVGSSRTGARTRVPCIGRRTLNHCATREALSYLSLFSNKVLYQSSIDLSSTYHLYLYLFVNLSLSIYLSFYLSINLPI